MAVARRQRIQEGSTAEAPKKRAGPLAVRETDANTTGGHPLADHLIRLEEAFSQEEAEYGPRYSGRARLAIMVGTPLVLWAALAGVAVGLRALF